MQKIIIDSQIFDLYPQFQRGIIIVKKIKNSLNQKEVSQLLDSQIKLFANFDWEKSNEIKIWDEAYLKFKTNPNKYPPSIKSLIKRACKNNQIPYINTVVALFNCISLKYLLPCGGDDLDMIKGNLRLGLASGQELFVPLGETTEEHPETGEVIYFDDLSLNVMCRRWNWRNGDFTKITEQTQKIIINLDNLDFNKNENLISARNELNEYLKQYCGAETELDLLNINKKEKTII